MERFYFKHDDATNILTIELSEGLGKYIQIFKDRFPIQMMQAETKVLNYVNDEGTEFKNVTRWQFKINKDEVEFLFDGFLSWYRQYISENIGHKDN